MSLAGLTPAAKTAVVCLCAWESVAITTGLLPTASQLCRRHRWAEAVLLGLLLAHLHYKDMPPPVVVAVLPPVLP